MLDRRLQELARRLGDDPDSVDAWAELAQLVARVDELPDFLESEADLPRICMAWLARPEEPALLEVVLRLLDAELVEAEPPEWWEENCRLETRDGLPYDLASGLPIRIRRRRDRAEMLLVPEGPFWCGRPAEAERVKLDPFYLDRFPVTVGAYAGYLRETGRTPPFQWVRQEVHTRNPVLFVNWEEAGDYARWAGGRLPSGHEWERAARGDERRAYFPWSGRLGVGPYFSEEGEANYNLYDEELQRDRWPEFIEPVGKRWTNVSPFGIQDLAGNTWEWCGDARGEDRQVRGGSWMDHGRTCHVFHHRYWPAGSRHPYLGFRVARPLFGPQQSL